ncbi:MAG: porin [bacterium]
MMKKASGFTAAVAFFFALSAIAGAKTVGVTVGDKELKADIGVLGQLVYVSDKSDQIVSDTFDVNRLRISIDSQPADAVKVKASLEESGNLSPLTPGLGGLGGRYGESSGAAGSRLVDLYVDLTYLDWVTVRAGQFPLPMGLELTADEYGLETINYSQLTSAFVHRDRGIMFFGDAGDDEIFDWAIGVVNGAGAETAAALAISGAVTGAVNDTNDRKDWFALLGVTPISNLYFESWYYDGTTTCVAGVCNATQTTSSDIDLWGLALDWSYYNFRFAGEYAQLKYSNAAAFTMKQKDWYLHGSYKIPETDLQLVLRYDRFDENTSTANNEIKVTTVGLNWDFEDNVRLQLNHEFVTMGTGTTNAAGALLYGEPSVTGGLSGEEDRTTLQLSFRI